MQLIVLGGIAERNGKRKDLATLFCRNPVQEGVAIAQRMHPNCCPFRDLTPFNENLLKNILPRAILENGHCSFAPS